MKIDPENLNRNERGTHCLTQTEFPEVSPGTDIAIVLSSHPQKGVTLIARQDAVAGIELCSAPTYEIDSTEREQLKALPIHKYVFVRSREFHCQDAHCRGYLAFGLISFCSHSDCPNAAIQWDTVDGQTMLRLFSLYHIKALEEVTIRYANVEEYQGASTWAN